MRRSLFLAPLVPLLMIACGGSGGASVSTGTVATASTASTATATTATGSNATATATATTGSTATGTTATGTTGSNALRVLYSVDAGPRAAVSVDGAAPAITLDSGQIALLGANNGTRRVRLTGTGYDASANFTLADRAVTAAFFGTVGAPYSSAVPDDLRPLGAGQAAFTLIHAAVGTASQTLSLAVVPPGRPVVEAVASFPNLRYGEWWRAPTIAAGTYDLVVTRGGTALPTRAVLELPAGRKPLFVLKLPGDVPGAVRYLLPNQ